MTHVPDRARGAARRLRAMTCRGGRAGQVLMAATVIGLLAAPIAVGQSAATSALDGGARNPSNNTSAQYAKETEIVGNIAQNAGGVAPGTGGYTTRQSNKSDSGGGAIYGCRATAGTESCVAANNLGNGDAFRFQATPSAATVGQIRFGQNPAQPVDKPPFTTNGTGLVKNLNADRVDGKSADDFLPAGSLLFAVVGGDGAIGASRGVANGAKATVMATGGNQVISVPFAGDVSKCAATASPTAPPAPGSGTRGELVVAIGGDGKSVVVTEPSADAPVGFHLQVTC
jgi:hypothetical protein